jgi:hypothetical protein
MSQEKTRTLSTHREPCGCTWVREQVHGSSFIRDRWHQLCAPCAAARDRIDADFNERRRVRQLREELA